MKTERNFPAPSTETDIGLSLSPRCAFYGGVAPESDTKMIFPLTSRHLMRRI